MTYIYMSYRVLFKRYTYQHSLHACDLPCLGHICVRWRQKSKYIHDLWQWCMLETRFLKERHLSFMRMSVVYLHQSTIKFIFNMYIRITNIFIVYLLKNLIYLEVLQWSPRCGFPYNCAWYACVDTRNSPSPLKLNFQWSLLPDGCIVVEPFLLCALPL